jgi:transcriptional regulator with XRE-family HTH domain
MSKLGEKIKEIRINEGLSQEAFARELGYTSKSTINKIEKGINEISYDKLMLLIDKYNLKLDQIFEINSNNIALPKNVNSNLYISFSARSNGNSESIIKYMMKDNDEFISFKDLFINSCSKCNYECMNANKCKYRYDDIYNLLDISLKYNKIIFVVPMYSGNPSSIYFILMERMQDYFSDNEINYPTFISKLHIIGIYGSNEETPFFIPLISGILDDFNKCLPIQRHKYEIKMNDIVIENKYIVNLIDLYKRKMGL